MAPSVGLTLITLIKFARLDYPFSARKNFQKLSCLPTKMLARVCNNTIVVIHEGCSRYSQNSIAQLMAQGSDSWLMAHGTWHMTHDVLRMAHGTRHMAHGTWLMAHGSWHMAHGAWHMAHGSWLMAHGSWLMAHGSGIHYPYYGSMTLAVLNAISCSTHGPLDSLSQ